MVIPPFRTILSVVILAALPSLVEALPPGPIPLKPAEKPLDAAALAAKIDELIAAGWTAANAQPAPPADDAEFMRRLYLDVAGRIPRVSEIRDFLDDKSSDKRQRLAEKLLQSPHYIQHFSSVWRDLLLPQNNNQQIQFLAPILESWLRKKLRENAGYDSLVREILAMPVSVNQGGRQQFFNPYNQAEPTPFAFYAANEQKPENLAASTSRLFLGIKLECAQCHDHPFAQIKRKQFWEYAAFFSGISAQGGNFFAAQDQPQKKEIKIPTTEKLVQARFLDQSEPQWKPGQPTRQTLAEWLVNPANPYFARTAANRLWAHFFGIGLVEPVDEFGDDNPASHAELLDLLARQYALHKFDMKYLIRAITGSKTYQLTSAGARTPLPTGERGRGEGQDENRLFTRLAIKGLTPEQLFDSLAQATGYREQQIPNQRFAFGINTPRTEFLNKFASQDKRTEHQTSILQALALMNGKFIEDATSLDRSETLAAVLDAPFLDISQRIETLYLAALTRKPRPEELTRMMNYVQAGGGKKDSKAALADVFWVLLNSSEFLLNH